MAADGPACHDDARRRRTDPPSRRNGVTAQQLLVALFNAGIAISIGATVLSLGMTYTVGQLVAPLHRVVLVIAMVVLNAGVIPALAWGIASPQRMASVRQARRCDGVRGGHGTTSARACAVFGYGICRLR
jgi:hypothetical protein